MRSPPDPLAVESLVLAGISAASVHGRTALGRRAGARVWRLGHDPEAPWVASAGPRQAHLDRFEKLAALIPRSRVNLVLYHGILAALPAGDLASWPPRL